jgi:hypothetical protein
MSYQLWRYAPRALLYALESLNPNIRPLEITAPSR